MIHTVKTMPVRSWSDPRTPLTMYFTPKPWIQWNIPDRLSRSAEYRSQADAIGCAYSRATRTIPLWICLLGDRGSEGSREPFRFPRRLPWLLGSAYSWPASDTFAMMPIGYACAVYGLIAAGQAGGRQASGVIACAVRRTSFGRTLVGPLEGVVELAQAR